MWTCSLNRMRSPNQLLLTTGCFFNAKAAAFTTMSLKLIFTSPPSLMALRVVIAAPMSTLTVK